MRGAAQDEGEREESCKDGTRYDFCGLSCLKRWLGDEDAKRIMSDEAMAGDGEAGEAKAAAEVR